jgi:hypothetical protein
LNVLAAVERWGLSRTGFFTLTFADHVLDPREAQRRLHSLSTGVLRDRYSEWMRVYERQGHGRIHYHLLVDIGADIRTGCDFNLIAQGDYRSAPPALRAEWAFWRRTAKLYGFGRTELLPIMSSAEAMGRYVGKYIGKHLGHRQSRDVGVRLVSYSGAAVRVASTKFAWAGGRGADWRAGLGALVRDLASTGRIDGPTTDAMRRAFGKRWAWDWKDVVCERAKTRERLRGKFTVDSTTGEIL